MIQIADIGGVYAVSFILMMVNYGIYLILKKDIKKSIKYSTTIICFCLLITCFSYGVFKINNKSFEKEIKIAVIQGNIPQDVKWREGSSPYILKEYLHLTKQAAEDNPQLIVWPESSFPEVLDRESYVFDSIVDVARQIKIPLLVGAITAEGNELYNSALLVSSDGEIVKKYNKLHLVPFGEYLPFKRLFSFVEHIAPAPIGDCASGKTYSVFSSESNNEKFSVLICFEDVFSNVARTFANGGAEFLAVITNDAWFKETTAPYQHVQASVFRAVENRIPIIRAANTGVSCFIDSSGKITSRVTDASSEKDIFISGYSSDIVRIPGGGSTFYMRYSDLFIVICCMFILISLFIEKKKQN